MSDVIQDSLFIHLALNDEPDTASFTLRPGAAAVQVLQTVQIGLGAPDNLLFAGQVSRVTRERREGNIPSPFQHVECIDWLRQFNRRLINRTYLDTSVTDIAENILFLDTYGFTGRGIEQGLPILPRFVLIDETPGAAFRRLAQAIGGSFVIRPNKDVRLFGPAGDQFPDAVTNPTVLTNTLSTLKAFSHTADITQQRTRTWVEGLSSSLVVEIPAGTDQATSIARGLPLSDEAGWHFATAPNPQGNYARVGPWIIEFEDCLPVTGPPATTVTGVGSPDTPAASPGDTQISVVDNSVYTPFGGTGWVHDGNGHYFFFVNHPSDPTILQSIPATGYGALTVPLLAGTPLYMAPWLRRVEVLVDPYALEIGPTSFSQAVELGESVAVRLQAYNTGQAGEIATREGLPGFFSLGFYEHKTSGPFAWDDAQRYADADVTAFSAVDGVWSFEWTTTDLNAWPGTQQTVNFTAPDPLSMTLTITSVDITWPIQNQPPFRRCRAADVKLPAFAEAILAARQEEL